MKNIAVLSAAALLLLSITACASNGEEYTPTPTTEQNTTSKSVEPAEDVVPSDDGVYNLSDGFALDYFSEYWDEESTESGAVINITFEEDSVPEDLKAALPEGASLATVTVDNREGSYPLSVGLFSAADTDGNNIEFEDIGWSTFFEDNMDIEDKYGYSEEVLPGRLSEIYLVSDDNVPEEVTNPLLEVDMENLEVYPLEDSGLQINK